MARLSPGSPSKWMATRSPRPASTCRSTQLYATLSVPSLNHLANGGFDQSSVSEGSLAQVSRRACSAQKPSLSALACSYASAVTLACAARSAGGANLRSSLSRLARLSLLTTSPFPRVSVVSQATAHQTRGCDDKGRRKNWFRPVRRCTAHAGLRASFSCSAAPSTFPSTRGSKPAPAPGATLAGG